MICFILAASAAVEEISNVSPSVEQVSQKCGSTDSTIWDKVRVIFFVSCLLEVVALSNKVSGVEIGEEKLTCMTTASKWNLKGEGEMIRSGDKGKNIFDKF